jgi:nitrate reductase NapE component
MTTTNGHHDITPPALAPFGPPPALPMRGPGQDRPHQDTRTEPDKDGRRRPDGRAFIVVALFAVAQVAVVAFSGSWQHQYELSVHLGQAHWVAGMQPLSVEGLIVSASLVIWYAARYKLRRPVGAYLVLAAGVGQTVLMNLGADYRWPWLGPEISVWPAVAFVAAYEMAVWLVRKRQDRAGATATGDTTDDDGRARSGQPGKNGGEGTGLAGSRAGTSPPSPRPATTSATAGDKDDKPPTTEDRLSVEEEAVRDGVSPGAIRKRRERARKAQDRSTT